MIDTAFDLRLFRELGAYMPATTGLYLFLPEGGETIVTVDVTKVDEQGLYDSLALAGPMNLRPGSYLRISEVLEATRLIRAVEQSLIKLNENTSLAKF